MASDPKARGKESPEPPKPSKAPKHMPSESPTESIAQSPKLPSGDLPRVRCVRCCAVAALALKSKKDDSDYITEGEVFGDNDDLMLRVVHYRRKKWITGCFYADCPPKYPSYEGVFYLDHLTAAPDKKRKLQDSLQSAINQYNQQTGDNLTSDGILHTTVEDYGCTIFYVTFKGLSNKKDGNQIYQTAVTCESPDDTGEHEVIIFRRKSCGKDYYEDLLPVTDSFFKEYTRVKMELMSTLDGHVLLGDPFYEDFKRIRAEQGVDINE